MSVKALLGLVMPVIALGSVPVDSPGTPPKPDGPALEFFEKEVRPLLATRCQGCHGHAKQKGGLRLDSRTSILAGGDTGPAVVPGKPGESLLVDAINYGDHVQMPPKSKLPPAEIADPDADGSRSGAPWPIDASARHQPARPRPADPAKERAEPLELPARPTHRAARRQGRRPGPARPIDRFILAGPGRQGPHARPRGRPPDLIRRVTLRPDRPAAHARGGRGVPGRPVARRLRDGSSTGCWPRPTTASAGRGTGSTWSATPRPPGTSSTTTSPTPTAIATTSSAPSTPTCRTTSSSSSTSPATCCERPAGIPADGFNESILGTGFFFLGEGTHSPVDVREEEAGRIDNQIDVLSQDVPRPDRRLRPLPRPQVRRDHDRRTTTRSRATSRARGIQHAFIDPPRPDRRQADRATR